MNLSWRRFLAWIVATLCVVSGIMPIAFKVSVGELPDWGIMAWILNAPILGLLLIRRSPHGPWAGFFS